MQEVENMGVLVTRGKAKTDHNSSLETIVSLSGMGGSLHQVSLQRRIVQFNAQQISNRITKLKGQEQETERKIQYTKKKTKEIAGIKRAKELRQWQVCKYIYIYICIYIYIYII